MQRGGLKLALAATLACALAAPQQAGATAAQPGFQETTVLSGLDHPTVVRLASNGEVLVAEQRGLVKRYDSLSDPTPETVANLARNVHNYWDRGLLGMALDPSFVSNRRIYVLYTHDAAIGGTAPRWGSVSSPEFDGCPTPPGPTADGCVVSARLSRITLDGTPNPPETVLVEDWCQQYPSHSIGSLEFDSQGNLYASGGDGASFGFVDWGQDGNPLNPCGDPPGGVGATLTPPTAQGGALRSLDLQTSGDPVGLDGTVIRIDPATGAGLPSNPNGGSSNANTKRIIAQGLRNPFRFAISPDDELWIGDVGWGDWEELNQMPSVPAGVVNFGWPCYEGNDRQGSYDAANLSICESLYSAGDPVADPALAYHHNDKVVPAESCPAGTSSAFASDFYEGGPFPSAYDGALFFADYSRDCIWAMQAGAGGDPNPADVVTFASGTINPTFLQVGPDGALYFTNFDAGQVRRIGYTVGNTPPTAVATASPASGSAPLAVQFDGSQSSDPDPGDTLDFAWDLDADGQYDDSTAVSPSRTYTTPGTVTVGLRVTDDDGATGTDTVPISIGNDPPVPNIAQPASTRRWGVNELINFSGSASDPQQGTLPASALDWELIMNHCPAGCHQHPVQTFPDRASGSFTAPDHEYPSTLILRLTATDAQGASASTQVELQPRTVQITLQTSPSGLNVALGPTSAASPLTRTVIEGSNNTISAPDPQTQGGRTWDFSSWSDGGAQSHAITASTNRTLTATFTRRNAAPTAIATASPDSGPAPLAVSFDGRPSSDPDPGDTLDYAWDIDGDGQYDDSTAVSPSRTYGVGSVTVGLRVTDDDGATATDTVPITAQNTPPVPQIATPADLSPWSAREAIGFSGSATDAQDGSLAASRLDWELRAGSAVVSSYPDRASGTLTAPDRTDPAQLTLRLTATDSHGATATRDVRLDPRTVQLALASAPSGLNLSLNGTGGASPLSRTVVRDSTNTIETPTPQTLNGRTWDFSSWSDGGAASHAITAGADRTLTATFTRRNAAPTAVATASPDSGPAPLAVQFDGSQSSDPDPGDTLDYAWDLDADGQYDDSTAVSPSRTYGIGAVTARLRVTDDDGLTATDAVLVSAGNDPPVPAIDAPTPGSRWSAGEQIPFSGGATDPQDGPLGAAALDWEVRAGSASLASFPGTASGSFTAPDRHLPGQLTLTLTATDSEGIDESDQLSLDASTVDVTLASEPAGLELGLNGTSAATPFTTTVVEDSTNTVSAPSPQSLGVELFEWSSWSDGGTAQHKVSAGASRTLSALFSPLDDRENPPELELEIETLKLRVPDSVRGLLERSGRARVSCNLDCYVTLKLLARGRAAEQIGIAGKIGRASADLAAGGPETLVAVLGKRAARKLEQADPKATPRVRAELDAQPATSPGARTRTGP